MTVPYIDNIERAKRPKRLPVVFTRDEVKRILENLTGTHHLGVALLYGTGMRLNEGLRVRVKDVDFDYRQITVRDGKGDKDHLTMLPTSLTPGSQMQLAKAKEIYDFELRQGRGDVELPYALARKYPNAEREWGWQYFFPASALSTDKRTGRTGRHHILESGVQKASEKSEGGATPDYGEWLEAFLAAAKGRQDMSANPYDQGSIVLVQFYRQHVRPCVIVTDAKSVRESDIYGIVPLAPSLSRPTGGLTPTFEKREGVLPTTSIALCSQLQMVEPARVISYVGQLDSRQLKLIQNGLAELFTLGPAPDARSVRKR